MEKVEQIRVLLEIEEWTREQPKLLAIRAQALAELSELNEEIAQNRRKDTGPQAIPAPKTPIFPADSGVQETDLPTYRR
jgi:hypothetical protein